ncbi:MAG TPA: hypothetical protein VM364_09145 [Vicinamibacterales bacterium]|nr:hypothetical protein [Vicinamibacterales bacterium]
MRTLVQIFVVALLVLPADVAGQARRTQRKPPAPPALKTEPAAVQCRESLGIGVRTKANYCFVLAGRDPAEGVIVTIPPRTGPAKLTFDLHNRHTYSEEEVKAGRGFASYTAVIGVLTMKGELLARGAVRSEFRTARDLHERIGGGAGPTGLKAVAPIGAETVSVEVPAGVTQVSLLGELLDALTTIGRESAAPGRPVAVVSNVRVEYRPK